jgi:putative holliday junction resolvase
MTMVGEMAGRVLAIDPGAVRIGVAVSNSAQTMAFPRPHLLAGGDLVQRLVALVSEEEAVAVIVGLPRTLAGGESASAAMARGLAEELGAALADQGIGVELVDERFTTVQASAALRAAGSSAKQQRGSIDSAAAAVLLQSVLDGRTP